MGIWPGTLDVVLCGGAVSMEFVSTHTKSESHAMSYGLLFFMMITFLPVVGFVSLSVLCAHDLVDLGLG